MTSKIIKSLNKKINFVQIVPVLVLLITSLVGCESGDSEWGSYKNSEYGFSVDYPVDWDTTEVDYRMLFGAQELYSDSADLVKEGFNISATFADNYTLDRIVTENEQTAKKYYPNAVVLSNDFKNENDVEGKQLGLEYALDGVMLAGLSTFFLRDKYLITITQTFEISKEKEYKERFETMLRSFKWEEKKN